MPNEDLATARGPSRPDPPLGGGAAGSTAARPQGAQRPPGPSAATGPSGCGLPRGAGLQPPALGTTPEGNPRLEELEPSLGFAPTRLGGAPAAASGAPPSPACHARRPRGAPRGEGRGGDEPRAGNNTSLGRTCSARRGKAPRAPLEEAGERRTPNGRKRLWTLISQASTITLMVNPSTFLETGLAS